MAATRRPTILFAAAVFLDECRGEQAKRKDQNAFLGTRAFFVAYSVTAVDDASLDATIHPEAFDYCFASWLFRIVAPAELVAPKNPPSVSSVACRDIRIVCFVATAENWSVGTYSQKTRSIRRV